ncbi:MAG TPA: RsmE family RNA methyltransferase [Gemmatimonadaceae bacterium]|nr:RsmE family RNA methyltransferase [Gemmatimonadaceae bacterium]
MVDGTGRSAVATFYAPDAWGERVELGEGAARHAHVRRLEMGDHVRLTSGDGRRAFGTLALLEKRRLVVECDHASISRTPRRRRVELWAPVGDRERMLLLGEKAVELGATAWRSVMYRRSRSVSPRGEGEAFAEKLRVRMIAALEQCGDAWLPEILPEAQADAVIPTAHVGGAILLDPLGLPFRDVLADAHVPVVLAVGPEGGLEPEERHAFEACGWRAASIGSNVLRFETAGIAALAITRALLRTT